MTVDLTPLSAALLPLVQAALLAATPILLAWLRSHLAVLHHQAASDAITAAAGRGAGLAYQMLASSAGSIGSVPLTNAAIAHGTEYVVKALPDTLAKLGVTPDRVAAMVTAELGRLLAIDPNVSIAPPVGDAGAPPVAARQAA